MADADKCVMCGEVIPEGTWVCQKCVINPPSSIPLYAIRHKETGRFMTGTDFRYCPPRQILSNYDSPLLFTGYNLLGELKRRKISMRCYTVVRVTVEEVK